MRKGGTGGKSTKTGLHFEGQVDLITFLSEQKGYRIKEGTEIYFNGEHVASSFKKNGLYIYLKEKGVHYEDHIARRLLPDDAIFVISNNTFFILEVKFQEVAGSVDEKLQTCHFKIGQYKKLLSPLRVDVQYIYILSDWFKKEEYKDVLDYITSIQGCSYYFGHLPLQKIGLPISE